MKNVTEIINDYTKGEATLEETNAALKEAGTDLYLDPYKNALTAEEIFATKAESAETATGWGLLDTGTGSLDKVEVKNGVLQNADLGDTYALVLIGGKRYEVKGTKLFEVM